MTFTVTGLNHSSSPVEIRERFAVDEDRIPDAISKLKTQYGVHECVVLSTCNRVELYTASSEPAAELVADFLTRFQGRGVDPREHLYSYVDDEAFRHLCRVASGLDSMVLGEPEVFGQVKEAFRFSQEAGGVGERFDDLFPRLFGVVKKIRSRLGVGKETLSVSSVAVLMAKEIFAELNGKRVMVLGAGEMARQTIEHLVRNGVSDVLVANRTFKRAVQLAERVQGTAIMLYEVPEYLHNVDIVIASTRSTEFVLTRDQLSEVGPTRGRQPLLMIDISVPRSIDPSTSEIEWVHLSNIDDLKSHVAANEQRRRFEAEKAESYIESRLPSISESWTALDIMPALVSIREAAEQIRKREVERAFETEDAASDGRSTMEEVTKKIVSEIMKHTTVTLRSYSGRQERNKTQERIHDTNL